jgi:hypothetical protein
MFSLVAPVAGNLAAIAVNASPAPVHVDITASTVGIALLATSDNGNTASLVFQLLT